METAALLEEGQWDAEFSRVQFISSRKSCELSLNPQVKSFYTSASPSKEATGGCGEGEHLPCAPNHHCNLMFSTSLQSFCFSFKWEKKYNTIYFRTQLLLSTLPSLWGFSHMFIFFVPCCIHSVVQTEWKQINFNAFSGKNESTPGKPILIKAFY